MIPTTGGLKQAGATQGVFDPTVFFKCELKLKVLPLKVFELFKTLELFFKIGGALKTFFFFDGFRSCSIP